jgi:hypothetical protein
MEGLVNSDIQFVLMEKPVEKWCNPDLRSRVDGGGVVWLRPESFMAFTRCS